MRKIAIVLALLMLAPASAFGMQMLTDSGMDQITGQSGVSIAMDDVQLFINIDTMGYVDNDGLSSSATMQIQGDIGAPGALYIQDFQIDVLNINAIVGTEPDAHPETLNLVSSSAGSIPLFYDYADTTPLSGGLKGLENYTSVNSRSLLSGAVPFTANAITIEVTDHLPVLTEGFNYNTYGIFAATVGGPRTNVGGVFITLPTAEIYIQALDFTVAYTGDVYAQTLASFMLLGPTDLYLGPMGALTSQAINDNEGMVGGFYPLEGDFGSIFMRGITFTQLSGWMEIAPH